MRFRFIDAVLERAPDRVVTLKRLAAAEDYLQDHFAGYPVMPGVLMLETMVQSARLLLDEQATGADPPAPPSTPWVLAGVRALKFASFVRPGESLRVEVTCSGVESGIARCRGRGWVLAPGQQHEPDAPAGVSARFELRPARTPTSPRPGPDALGIPPGSG